VHDRGHHGLDHVAGLGRTGRYRCGFHRRNGNAYTGGKDVGVFRIALERVHQHETARVAQSLDGSHAVHALERRQHHRVTERQLDVLDLLLVIVVPLDEHPAGLYLDHLGVGDPLDVVMTQFAFQHAAGIAHATQPEVADVRFAGDIGHRDFFAQPLLAQVGIDDEGVLVGRAETARKRHGANHDRAGILNEPLITGMGLFGVIDGTDGNGMPFRTGTRYFIEGQFRAGGDQQVVIGHAGTRRKFEPVVFRVDAGHLRSNEVDVFLFQWRCDWKGDVLALAPTYTDPRIGRDKLEVIPLIDHGNLVLLAQLCA
jgi:hypothetical protein